MLTHLSKYIFIIALALVGLSGLSGAEYYIDYDKGSDAATGASATAAFKHCPGDPQAQGKAQSTQITAGDRVYFKGGVHYRGNIRLSASGTETKKIILDGQSFGDSRAIIDGSDIVDGWKSCESEKDCHGNPQWKNIQWAPLPKNLAADFSWNLSQGDQLGRVSESHNAKSAYLMTPAAYKSIPTKQATRTSIIDSELQIFAKGGLTDAYIAVLCKPMWIYRTKITSYDAASNKLVFKQHSRIKSYYGTVKYNILNSPICIDSPGEYCIDKQNGRVYFWPYQDIAEQPVSIARRAIGIELDGASHVTVTGFKIQKFSCGLGEKGGNAIRAKGASHIEITNNKICMNNSSSKQGVLNLTKISKSLVADNHIYHNPFYRVIITDGVSDTVLRGNFLDNNSGTGFVMYRCNNVTLDGNAVRDHIAIHSQAIAIYVNSNNTTVKNNYIENGTALTLQASLNAQIENNIFDAKAKGIAIGLWNGGVATAQIERNTLIGSTTGGWQKDMSIFSNNGSKGSAYEIKDNLLDGVSGSNIKASKITGNTFTSSTKGNANNGNSIVDLTKELALFQGGNHKVFQSKGAQITEDHGIHLIEKFTKASRAETATDDKRSAKKTTKKEQRRAAKKKAEPEQVNTVDLQHKLDDYLANNTRKPRFHYSIVKGDVEIQKKSEDKYTVVVLKMGATMTIDLFRKMNSSDAEALAQILPQ